MSVLQLSTMTQFIQSRRKHNLYLRFRYFFSQVTDLPYEIVNTQKQVSVCSQWSYATLSYICKDQSVAHLPGRQDVIRPGHLKLTFNSFTKNAGSPCIIHPCTPDCHPVSWVWITSQLNVTLSCKLCGPLT